MRKDNRGQVLIIVALAFVVFLGFAALAVDVAYMYTVRNELQRCADAGALAGASMFKESGTYGRHFPGILPGVPGEPLGAFTPRETVAATSQLNYFTEVDVSLPPPKPDPRRYTPHREPLFRSHLRAKTRNDQRARRREAAPDPHGPRTKSFDWWSRRNMNRINCLIVDSDQEAIQQIDALSRKVGNVEVRWKTNSMKTGFEIIRKHLPEMAIVSLGAGTDSEIESLSAMARDFPFLYLLALSERGGRTTPNLF